MELLVPKLGLEFSKVAQTHVNYNINSLVLALIRSGYIYLCQGKLKLRKANAAPLHSLPAVLSEISNCLKPLKMDVINAIELLFFSFGSFLSYLKVTNLSYY